MREFKHLLGIDLESWVLLDKAFGKVLTNKQRLEIDNGEILRSLDEILLILKKNNQKVTFFVVFRLEELYPGIIKKILDSGHEVGWHGYSHAPLTNKTILKKELAKSEQLLNKYKIKGFQAPYIIFFKEGYKILKEYGLTYSSSIYGNSQKIYNFNGILEIPVSTNKKSFNPGRNEVRFPSHMSIKNLLKFGIPFGSSYFWSIFKKSYYQKKFDVANSEKQVVNIFTHNWQLYPKPQIKSWNNKLLIFLKNPLFYPYTINVSEVFKFLLKNYKFQRFEDFLDEN